MRYGYDMIETEEFVNHEPQMMGMRGGKGGGAVVFTKFCTSSFLDKVQTITILFSILTEKLSKLPLS